MTRLVTYLCDILVRNLPSFCSCPKNVNEVKLKDDEPMYLVGKRCVGKVKGLYKEGAKTKDSRDIFNLKRFVRSLMHGPGTIEKHFPGEEHSCHLTGWADLKLAEETGHCHRVVLVLKARKTQKFRESRRPVEARVTNSEERP